MRGVFRKWLALGLIISVASSCTTTKISSNKSPDFNQKVSRVFLTVRGSEGSKKFMQPLATSLQSELKNHGVESSHHYFDPLSLETEKDLIQKIREYNPDVVMSIVQTERRSTSGQYGNAETGATLDIRLLIPNQDKPVWRASLIVDGNFEVAAGSAAQQSASKLIEKLKMDGIID